MTELKPCPLCQSENVTDWSAFGNLEVPQKLGIARCCDCGCSAPIAAWNTRAAEKE